MDLKSILVYVDTDERHRQQRLDLAVALARSHEAHIVGLFVIDSPVLPLYATADMPADWLEQQMERSRANAAAAETWFRAEADRAGVSAEWRCPTGETGETVAMHARYADLVALSQAEPESEAVASWRYLMESVVMDSGRPALLVPYIGAVGGADSVGRNILVAWNATREATRAVNDAMPILRRAEKVTLLAVDPEGGSAGHGDIPSADIALHLARHGVKAEAAQTFARDIDVADAILSRVADLGADMIVMGAYGHSRFREMVLGGVTRAVLDHMTVPVLMSH